MKKITIIKNGPYKVEGGIPLTESIIEEKYGVHEYANIKKYKTEKTYLLCRCGHSKNAPFCDGEHQKIDFDGELTASKEPISKTSEKIIGENIILEDKEDLCAFARFCHYKFDDVWSLTEESKDKEKEKLAIKLANDCPAGRLVMKDKKTGNPIERTYEPEIEILQDPNENCSGPLFVKGSILIEDENGPYEVRNRVTLCRCGKSGNKPFCDASHLAGYKDRE